MCIEQSFASGGAEAVGAAKRAAAKAEAAVNKRAEEDEETGSVGKLFGMFSESLLGY